VSHKKVQIVGLEKRRQMGDAHSGMKTAMLSNNTNGGKPSAFLPGSENGLKTHNIMNLPG
jgi:hypothetical protein